MDIPTKKYHLIEWITNIRDTKLLDKLIKLAKEDDRSTLEVGNKEMSEDKEREAKAFEWSEDVNEIKEKISADSAVPQSIP